MGTRVNFYQELVSLTFILRILVFIFSTNKNKLLKQFYNMTKPTKWHVRPAKIQISLGICRVWSESSLSIWRKLRSLTTYWAHSEDSDQSGRMPRLIWVFDGSSHFVGFVTRQLIYVYGKYQVSMEKFP